VRGDVRLRADRDLVADRRALLDPDVVADVARPPDDRALDQRAPADVRRLLSVDGRVKYRASVFVSRLTIPLEISASSRVFFETPAIENG